MYIYTAYYVLPIDCLLIAQYIHTYIYIYTAHYALPIDCLLIVLDAHMFSHTGYGPGTKAQGPRSWVPQSIRNQKPIYNR